MNTSFAETYKPHGMPLSLLCGGAGMECPKTYAHIMVKGVTSDSRRVKAGWLFVALKGNRHNGEDFIPMACKLGASAVVVEGEMPTPWVYDVPCLTTPNARETLAYLCDAWYDHPTEGLRLVGVTGTNGKTSVSAMIAHILKTAGVPCGVIGTVGSISPYGHPICVSPLEATAHMTTPDPEELYEILRHMADEVGHDENAVVVMEVTSHALALHKTDPLNFEVGVFTNLTPEHLDFHGDMENYFKAKRRMFACVRRAVINADDFYGRQLLLDKSLSVETYDLCQIEPGTLDHDLCPPTNCRRVYAGQIVSMGVDGVEYRLVTPDARLRIKCPVPGDFTVKNSVQAATVAMALGIHPSKVQKALWGFSGVAGRMERVMLPTHVKFSVFLDYAHTPDALENLLLTAQKFKKRGQRVVILFGCGGDRDPSKRAVMANVASRLGDMVIITSDNSRTEDPDRIIEDIMEGMDRECAHVVIPNREKAIQYAIRFAKRGDIILLAGKGHEMYELDKNGQHPFCERDIVIAATKAYHPSHI